MMLLVWSLLFTCFLIWSFLTCSTLGRASLTYDLVVATCIYFLSYFVILHLLFTGSLLFAYAMVLTQWHLHIHYTLATCLALTHSLRTTVLLHVLLLTSHLPMLCLLILIPQYSLLNRSSSLAKPPPTTWRFYLNIEWWWWVASVHPAEED